MIKTVSLFKGQGQQHKGQQDGLEGQNHVLTSTNSSRPRNRGHLTRVRQSRSLNRISELHVVADFSESETDLLTRYLDTVNLKGQTRSRDDSLTSSDGEFEGPQTTQPQQSQPRRSKVNLRLLEQRLNKIQEESLNKNEGEMEMFLKL